MTTHPHQPLVLFDLVSTLADSGPRYARAFQDVMTRYGFDAPAAHDVLALLGNKNLSEITDEYTNLKDTDKEKFMNDCNHACDALLWDKKWVEGPFPHVKETVIALQQKGYSLGVFTGTREEAMQTQLAYADLIDHIPAHMLRGKDNQRDAWKKSIDLKTEQLKSLAAEGNFAPVFVVGDSKADLLAAQALGFVFIGFAPTADKKKSLMDAGATILFDDFSKLEGVISTLLAQQAKPVSSQVKAPRRQP